MEKKTVLFIAAFVLTLAQYLTVILVSAALVATKTAKVLFRFTGT